MNAAQNQDELRDTIGLCFDSSPSEGEINGQKDKTFHLVAALFRGKLKNLRPLKDFKEIRSKKIHLRERNISFLMDVLNEISYYQNGTLKTLNGQETYIPDSGYLLLPICLSGDGHTLSQFNEHPVNKIYSVNKKADRYMGILANLFAGAFLQIYRMQMHIKSYDFIIYLNNLPFRFGQNDEDFRPLKEKIKYHIENGIMKLNPGDNLNIEIHVKTEAEVTEFLSVNENQLNTSLKEIFRGFQLLPKYIDLLANSVRFYYDYKFNPSEFDSRHSFMLEPISLLERHGLASMNRIYYKSPEEQLHIEPYSLD